MGMAMLHQMLAATRRTSRGYPGSYDDLHDIQAGEFVRTTNDCKAVCDDPVLAVLLPHCLQCHRPPVQFIQQSNRRILMMLVRQEIVVVVEQTRGVLYRH